MPAPPRLGLNDTTRSKYCHQPEASGKQRPIAGSRLRSAGRSKVPRLDVGHVQDPSADHLRPAKRDGQVKSRTHSAARGDQGLGAASWAPMCWSTTRPAMPAVAGHSQSRTFLSSVTRLRARFLGLQQLLPRCRPGRGLFSFSRSTNGGATWVEISAHPAALAASTPGDPSITWRKSDGNLSPVLLSTPTA